MPDLIVKKMYPYSGKYYRPGEIHKSVPMKHAKLLVAIAKADYHKAESNPAPQESEEDAAASEAVKKFAAEEGIDLSKVEGTGKNGRITKSDVQSYKTRMMTAESYETKDMKAE